MLYTAQSFLGSGEEDSKYCVSYMGIKAILFNGAEPFDLIVKTHLTKDPI